ncbi:MAG TPA: phosphatase PAP2 family protein [Actinomycetes bacterium]|nr:phosphatase PAP2 family protein [Actinomycetes bacterium]
MPTAAHVASGGRSTTAGQTPVSRPTPVSPRRHDWRAVPRELAVVGGGAVLYFGVRGLTEGDVAAANRHARQLVELEQALGIHAEEAVQEPVARSDTLTAVMNWIYIWGHWPVIIATLLWLVLSHPTVYARTRDAMLLSGAVGMVIFALWPVAPPRLADLGLVDTVTEYSRSYRVLQPPAFTNQYAAMPSLHVGWDLLIGLAIVVAASRLWVRVIGGLLPMLMGWAVVATANHFVLDAAVGVLLVLVSLRLVTRRPSVTSRLRRRATGAGASHPRPTPGAPT